MIDIFDENIKCEQEHHVSDMSFFFFYSPNPCNMSHKKRKYQDQPSHSALVTNALLNGRASVLNIKQEPNGNSSLIFFFFGEQRQTSILTPCFSWFDISLTVKANAYI